MAYTLVAYAPAHRGERAHYLAYAHTSAFVPEISRAGGPQAWVDQIVPPVGSFAYGLYVYEARYAPSFVRHLRVVAVYLTWPWLTLGALMVFRASMRRAKVRTVHVLRCTLYGCDAAPWLAAGAAVAVPVRVDRFDLGRSTGYSVVAVAAVVVFGFATTWRLSVAYRHYLRFDHPLATAAASHRSSWCLWCGCTAMRWGFRCRDARVALVPSPQGGEGGSTSAFLYTSANLRGHAGCGGAPGRSQ